VKSGERPSGAASIYNLSTISSLQNPVYRLYFLGMLGQFASMNMQMVAGSMLIYRLTDSSGLLGTMSLANAVPMILISMFGGAIADRVQKKRVLVIGLTASAAISLFVALALTTGHLSKAVPGSWWILIFSSFLQGCVMGITLPARQAIIPEIVSREHAMNAVALNMLGMNVLSLFAPGVAGFLIDGFDFKAVYFTMTALNIYAAVTIAFVRHTSVISNQTGNILDDIKKGLKYMGQDRTIFFVLMFTLMVVVLGMPYQNLLPIYVDDILHVGATGLGVLMSVSGVGALVGSIVLASLPSKKRGLLILCGGLLSGASLVFFAFSRSWGLSLGLIVFIGLGQTIRGTVSSALLQSYTRPEFMGRVMSILMMQWGVMSLCTFGAGLLAEIVPVQRVVGGFAVALIIVSILSLFFIPRIRRLD
jgi:MFS family permease